MSDISTPNFTTPDFINIDSATSDTKTVTDTTNKRVLVIEDLAEMRFMLKSLMASLGFQHIDTEASGQAAVKRIMEKHYDIVLSDFNLGGSVDGQQILEITRKTYALDHSTIFIMITADTAYESVVSILEYQPDSYLVKPFPPEAFVRRLQKVRAQKKVFKIVNDHRLNKDFEQVELEANKIALLYPQYSHLCSKIVGESLFERQSYKEAKRHYMFIIQKNKNLAWAYYGIAQCEFKLGAMMAAVKNLEQTLTLSRHFLSAYDLLADAYVKLSKLPEAQQTLKRVVEVSPRTLERSQRLASLSQTIEDWQVAELSYARVVRLAKESSFDKVEIYYDHLKSITDCINHGVDDNKLADRFKRSLARLRQLGKNNPTAVSNSFRLEIQQLLARKHTFEAVKSWHIWNKLIQAGRASKMTEAQEFTLKKHLGLN